MPVAGLPTPHGVWVGWGKEIDRSKIPSESLDGSTDVSDGELAKYGWTIPRSSTFDQCPTLPGAGRSGSSQVNWSAERGRIVSRKGT